MYVLLSLVASLILMEHHMFSPTFLSFDLTAYVSPSVSSQLSEEIPPFFEAGAIFVCDVFSRFCREVTASCIIIHLRFTLLGLSLMCRCGHLGVSSWELWVLPVLMYRVVPRTLELGVVGGRSSWWIRPCTHLEM